jgi:hypothetical protein
LSFFNLGCGFTNASRQRPYPIGIIFCPTF